MTSYPPQNHSLNPMPTIALTNSSYQTGAQVPSSIVSYSSNLVAPNTGTTMLYGGRKTRGKKSRKSRRKRQTRSRRPRNRY